MLTIKDVLNLSRNYLEKKGLSNPRRESEEVLSIALDLPRLEIYLNYDKPLNDDEVQKCREVLSRVAQLEPYAYIKGFVRFYDCLINVNQDVLIPRCETELLVDRVSKSITTEISLLDLCTGSGCISISLKKKHSHLKVVATDISYKALDQAKFNAQKNNVDICFIQSDFFESINERFDLIVSNPPYISDEEFKGLDLSVSLYEPKLALVADCDGLYFYQKFASEAKAYLNIDGKVWLEIGYAQGNSVKNIFEKEGWKNCAVIKDYSDNDRFFTATLGLVDSF